VTEHSSAARPGEEPRSRASGDRCVVVGFDSSPAAGRAARLALTLVPPPGGRIWFVHAAEPDRRMAEPLPDEEREAPARAIARAMGVLVAEARARGVAAEAWSREGPAAETILAAAREAGAEMIVVGTRGPGDASRLLLGSVSAHVVAGAKVPVVVVP